MRAQLAKLEGSENGASGGVIVPKGQFPGAGLKYNHKLRDIKYNEAIFRYPGVPVRDRQAG
jgi:hypothetical protein